MLKRLSRLAQQGFLLALLQTNDGVAILVAQGWSRSFDLTVRRAADLTSRGLVLRLASGPCVWPSIVWGETMALALRHD